MFQFGSAGSQRALDIAQDARRGGLLDAFRCLAAVVAAVWALAAVAPDAPDWARAIAARAWMAADLFLLLSGFVLARGCGPDLDAGRLDWAGFLARRLGRIWPSHLAALALLILVGGLVSAGGPSPVADRLAFDPGSLLLQAGLGQALGFGGAGLGGLSAWTLSALVIGWALFPLAWRATKGVAGRAASLLLALDVIMAAALFCRFVLGANLADLTPALALARALPLFLAGVLLGRAAEGLTMSRWDSALSLLGCGVGVALFIAMGRGVLSDLGVLFLIAFAVLTADGFKGWRSPRLARLAGLSFSLCLVALPSALLARWVLAGLAGGLEPGFALLLGGAFVLFAAVVFDHYVDAPLRRAVRARLRRAAARDLAGQAV